MKKLLSCLLAMVMAFSLTACGDSGEASGAEEPEQSAVSAEETADTSDAPAEEQPQPEEAPAEPEPAPAQTTGLRPDFKEAMDSYEAFYDEYCAAMQQMSEDPGNLEVLASYTEMLGKMEDMSEAFDAWESEDLNDEEMAYYLDVNNRVLKKMLAVTGD